MNRDLLVNELNQLLATEMASLARHLDEAKPHLNRQTYPVWEQIRHLSTQSDEHASRLISVFERIRVSPKPSTFEQSVASFHFISLPSLLPRLIEEKARQVSAYARAITHAGDDAETVSVLESLRTAAEEQAAELQAALAHLTPCEQN